MKPKIKVLRDTILKLKPVPSEQLSEAEKYEVKAGKEFELHSYSYVRNHIRFALSKDFFKGRNTWYAFGKHVQIVTDQRKPPISKPSGASSVKLSVPYKSQLDNWYNPTGSCNVTSLSMCLEYLGASRKSSYGQFEDELYEYAENRGLSRHEPLDLAQIVEAYGCRDDFNPNATIEEVKRWLAGGNPAVIHGYFTSSGHIIALVGYDSNGFIVHDPYGEWFSTGYRTDLSGAFLPYSYDLIRQTCIPDGDFWVHFISR
jgi:uncharacterized protein YvpB